MSQSEQQTAIVTGGAKGIGTETAHRRNTDGFAVAGQDLEECGATASAEQSSLRGERSRRVGRAGLPQDSAHDAAFFQSAQQVSYQGSCSLSAGIHALRAGRLDQNFQG